jgi:hypothetical protein
MHTQAKTRVCGLAKDGTTDTHAHSEQGTHTERDTSTHTERDTSTHTTTHAHREDMHNSIVIHTHTKSIVVIQYYTYSSVV